MNEHLLNLIDNIDETIVESEVSVLNSLHDLYEKQYMFLEYCESIDENYQFIQESLFMEADEEKKPNKIVSILKAIGAAIMSFVRSIVRKIKDFFDKRRKKKFIMLIYDYFKHGENSKLIKMANKKGWEVNEVEGWLAIRNKKGKLLFVIDKSDRYWAADNNLSGALNSIVESNLPIYVPINQTKFRLYVDRLMTIFDDIIEKNKIKEKEVACELKELQQIGDEFIASFNQFKIDSAADVMVPTRKNYMDLDQFGDTFEYMEKAAVALDQMRLNKDLNDDRFAEVLMNIKSQLSRILPEISEMINAAASIMSYETSGGTLGMIKHEDKPGGEFRSSMAVNNISSIITYNSYYSSPVGFDTSEITDLNYNDRWVQPDKMLDKNKYRLISLFWEHNCFILPCFGKLPNSDKWFVITPRIYTVSDGTEAHWKNIFERGDHIHVSNHYGFICNNKNTCEVLATFFMYQPAALLSKLFKGVCHPFDKTEAGEDKLESNTSHILIDMSKMHAILERILSDTKSVDHEVEDNRAYFYAADQLDCTETLRNAGFDSKLREEESAYPLYSIKV